MTKTIPAIASIVFPLLLAGCGNKGSLVLPDAPAPVDEAPPAQPLADPAALDPTATDQAADDAGAPGTAPFDTVPNLTDAPVPPADAGDADVAPEPPPGDDDGND